VITILGRPICADFFAPNLLNMRRLSLGGRIGNASLDNNSRHSFIAFSKQSLEKLGFSSKHKRKTDGFGMLEDDDDDDQHGLLNAGSIFVSSTNDEDEIPQTIPFQADSDDESDLDGEASFAFDISEEDPDNSAEKDKSTLPAQGQLEQTKNRRETSRSSHVRVRDPSTKKEMTRSSHDRTRRPSIKKEGPVRCVKSEHCRRTHLQLNFSTSFRGLERIESDPLERKKGEARRRKSTSNKREERKVHRVESDPIKKVGTETRRIKSVPSKEKRMRRAKSDDAMKRTKSQVNGLISEFSRQERHVHRSKSDDTMRRTKSQVNGLKSEPTRHKRQKAKSDHIRKERRTGRTKSDFLKEERKVNRTKSNPIRRERQVEQTKSDPRRESRVCRTNSDQSDLRKRGPRPPQRKKSDPGDLERMILQTR